MVFTVDFTNLKGATMKVEKLGRTIPTASKAAATEVSDKIGRYMRGFAPFWSGNLRTSIDSVPIGPNTIGVKMIFYGRFVETGVIIRSIPPKLKVWAISKAGKNAPFLLAGMLRKGYTEPHPFVQPAIVRIRSEMNEILRRHITDGIRMAGFKG